MGEGQVAWTGVFLNTWACDPVVPPGLQRTAGPNPASLVIKDPEHLGGPAAAAPLETFGFPLRPAWAVLISPQGSLSQAAGCS